MRINVLKFVALLITLPLIVNLGFSQKDAIGPLLYDQISNPTPDYPNSMYSFQASDAASSTKTTFSADDFTVPAGETWKIAYIDVLGVVDTYASTPDVDSVNVFIYNMSDTADMPAATEVYSASRVTDIDYRGDGDFIINLSDLITLTEGTYWVSIQPYKDHSTDGYWKWEVQESGSNGFPFHYKNPGLGYYYDAPDWTSSQQIVSYYSSFDLSFAFYGNRKDNDLAIESISSPTSGGSLGLEEVTVTIENRGLLDQSNVDIRYQVNANGWVTENVPVTIAAGTTHTFTFATKADLTTVANYTITAETQLTGDENAANDSYSWNVTNFGQLYYFGTFDSISTCSGGFVDPGGPVNDWEGAHGDTCTIYPTTENGRTRLIFTEFDNGWEEFHIYDGEDVNAPEIDLTPDNDNTYYAYNTTIKDTVTAKNTAGALTIVWSTNSGSAPGWFADIACFTPPADDFALVDIWQSIPTIFEGDNVDIKAVIYNAGLDTQSKEVSFMLDGNAFGSVTSDEIAPDQYDTIVMPWTPSAGGTYIFEASIPDDEGVDNDNIIYDTISVYAEGDLVESFENEAFPPEFWSRVSNGFFRNTFDVFNMEGSSYAKTAIQDTLVTPRLIIEDGDMLHFKAYSSPWWYASLDLYWSETPTGPWHLIQNIAVDPFNNAFQDFSVDISAAAGNNYIAFATGAPSMSGSSIDMNIDFVRGPQIFYYDHNITASNINGDISPLQNDTLNYTVNIKNNGLEDLQASDYTVKLMMDDGEYGAVELVSLPGEALASKESMDYVFEYAFTEIGPAPIYGEVDYAADNDLDDNMTDMLNLYVLGEDTDTTAVGDSEEYTTAGYPYIGNAASEVSQTLYTNNEVGEAGVINGITYFYQNESANDFENMPLQLWIAETTDSDLSSGLKSSDNFTLVYNDSVTLQASSTGELFLPFENPYIYNGENLIVMAYREDDGRNLMTYFQSADSDLPNRSTKIKYIYGPIDLSNDSIMNAHYSLEHKSTLPNTVFHKNIAGNGQVNGYAYDENGDPFEGVDVKIANTNAVTTTDEFGFYEFNVVPEGDAIIIAKKFGYSDITDTAIVLPGAITTLNFNMTTKPEVLVSGRVIRSDDSTSIADLSVMLNGYVNYQTTTDADGYFTFSDIYANENYELNIDFAQFDLYSSIVEVPDTADLNLGDIVLQETFEPAFFVNANETNNGMEVSWNKPHTGTQDSISLHNEEGFYTGYAAEPNENVWMGNLFDIAESGSIRGFNIMIYNYDGYDYTEGDVTLDIFNMNEDLVASVPFTIPVNENPEIYTIHIDVPDVTFDGSFYAMIHWEGLDFITPLVAFEKGVEQTAPNLARYKYEGQSMQMFSDIGTEGIFEIGAEVILNNGKSMTIENGKAREGYNIYRGLTSDMSNANNWEPINVDLITSTEDVATYIDETWPPAEEDFYTYAVEAVYSESESELSFSQTVSYGLYSDLPFVITTNSGEIAEGAVITLENNNGNELYVYDAAADDSGLANISMVRDGTYSITVQKTGYNAYVDNNFVIDNHSDVVEIELEETLIAPSSIAVLIDNGMHTAELTWSMTTTEEYILDDDSFENGLSLNPGADGYLGNLFEVSDEGTILEFKVHGQQATGLSGEQVTIEVFDTDGNSLGVTNEFSIQAEEWTTISVDSIEYSGSFYAMVHWNNLTGNTNFLSLDTNGPNVSQGYYYDENNGFLSITDIGAEPGVFLLRATALVNASKEPVTINATKVNNGNAQNVNNTLLESNRTGTAYAESLLEPEISGKELLSYNVFLNNMVEPMATGITETTYVFTEDDLLTNGLHTAGVSAVYTTGESAIIETDFDISFVSVDDTFMEHISVYPNPANNEIFINNAEGAHITIYGMKGSSVLQMNNFDKSSINISSLESGLYIIRIIKNGNVHKSKIEVINK